VSKDIQPLNYSLDEARHRLRKPALSRTGMYDLIKSGKLRVAGYFGDRPFFTDAELQDCTEQLKQQHRRSA
jgi:hypothetical protein